MKNAIAPTASNPGTFTYTVRRPDGLAPVRWTGEIFAVGGRLVVDLDRNGNEFVHMVDRAPGDVDLWWRVVAELKALSAMAPEMGDARTRRTLADKMIAALG